MGERDQLRQMSSEAAAMVERWSYLIKNLCLRPATALAFGLDRT